MTISGIWRVVKGVTGVAYKAAFLYLAYVFVTNTIGFFQFCVEAGMAFYKLQQGIPV